jgi:polar amino acid transport system permease protein
VLVFGTVSVIYFMLCWPLSLYAGHLERKLGQGRTTATRKPLLMAS